MLIIPMQQYGVFLNGCSIKIFHHQFSVPKSLMLNFDSFLYLVIYCENTFKTGPALAAAYIFFINLWIFYHLWLLNTLLWICGKFKFLKSLSSSFKGNLIIYSYYLCFDSEVELFFCTQKKFCHTLRMWL